MARKLRLLLFIVLALEMLPTSPGKAQSGLPVDVPRQDVFIADQIVRYTSVDNFNMWVNGVDTPNRHAFLMETLWYADAETGKTVYGAAASDPVYNKDFTEMTVKLRDNIACSDGVPFSAEDQIYTVQAIMTQPKIHDG